MLIARDDSLLTVQAPAKVNLHLEILGKRADGYHDVETLLVAVSLYDTLVFRAYSHGTAVRCTDPTLENDDNLVTRAVSLVRKVSGRKDGVAIALHKRIPLAAGLAGGSSDAAATLAGLNVWWDLGWPPQQLMELGACLGSDVPFFFQLPAAIGRGRGEKLTPVALPRSLALVLVTPPVGCSTKEVFARVTVPTEPVSLTPLLNALAAANLTEVAGRLHNRLEEAAVGLCPAVANLRQQAQTWICLGSRMSGSGSTYFALCADQAQAAALGIRLQAQNIGRVFVVNSCQ